MKQQFSDIRQQEIWTAIPERRETNKASNMLAPAHGPERVSKLWSKKNESHRAQCLAEWRRQRSEFRELKATRICKANPREEGVRETLSFRLTTNITFLPSERKLPQNGDRPSKSNNRTILIEKDTQGWEYLIFPQANSERPCNT